MDSQTRALRKAKSHYAEAECRRLLVEQGWQVDFAGLLDFVCQKGDQIMFVEVKSGDNELYAKLGF